MGLLSMVYLAFARNHNPLGPKHCCRRLSSRTRWLQIGQRLLSGRFRSRCSFSSRSRIATHLSVFHAFDRCGFALRTLIRHLFAAAGGDSNCQQ